MAKPARVLSARVLETTSLQAPPNAAVRRTSPVLNTTSPRTSPRGTVVAKPPAQASVKRMTSPTRAPLAADRLVQGSARMVESPAFMRQGGATLSAPQLITAPTLGSARGVESPAFVSAQGVDSPAFMSARAAQPPVFVKPAAKATAARWSKDQVYCIGKHGQAWGLLEEVLLLDKQKFTSVDTAVVALNNGSISCRGYCLVWMGNNFYLMWPSDKKTVEAMEFIALVKSGAKHREVLTNSARFNVGQAQPSTAQPPQALLPETPRPDDFPLSRELTPHRLPVAVRGDVNLQSPTSSRPVSEPTSSKPVTPRRDLTAPVEYLSAPVPLQSNARNMDKALDAEFAASYHSNGHPDKEEEEYKASANQSWGEFFSSIFACVERDKGPNSPRAVQPIFERPASTDPESADLGDRRPDSKPTPPQPVPKPRQMQGQAILAGNPQVLHRPPPETLSAPVYRENDRSKAYPPGMSSATNLASFSTPNTVTVQVAVPPNGSASATVPASDYISPRFVSSPVGQHSGSNSARFAVPTGGSSVASSTAGSRAGSTRMSLSGVCQSARLAPGTFTPVRSTTGPLQQMQRSSTGLGQAGSMQSLSSRNASSSSFQGTPPVTGAGSAGASAVPTGRPTPPLLASYESTQRLPKSGVLQSARRPAAPDAVALPHVAQMTVEDMWIDLDEFDITCRDLRLQLLTKLGFKEHGDLEALRDSTGACKNGVWHLSTIDSPGLVLKLVETCENQSVSIMDVERFAKIQARFPEIVKELAFAFPVKILQLRGPLGNRLKDLIVMRRAPGESLELIIHRKAQAGEIAAIFDILRQFGTFLRTVHQVYNGMQHGNCQPSKVFYDEKCKNFTLIDVVDLGFGPNDVDEFAAALNTLSGNYGSELAAAVKIFREAAA